MSDWLWDSGRGAAAARKRILCGQGSCVARCAGLTSRGCYRTQESPPEGGPVYESERERETALGKMPGSLRVM